MGTGFGIIGTGMIADRHARAIEATTQGRLVACFDLDADRARSFSGNHGCAAHSDLDAFLAAEGLEIVAICTPSGAHMEPAVAAAEAGKHVVVEKPLEVTLERCDRIIDACDAGGVLCSGIFQSRFFEVSRIVKTAIDEGRFGKLTLGDAYVKWHRTQEYYDTGGWHGTWKLDGGGALMNQSVHAIDLLQWLMGPVREVRAMMGTLGHTGIEVEDTAVAVLRFANGALGVIEGSTAVYPGYHKKIEIAGTAGSVVMIQEWLESLHFQAQRPGDREILRRFSGLERTGGGASDPAQGAIEGHQRQFENMMEAVRTGGEPAVDGREARKAVEIILAVYQSAREDRSVILPLRTDPVHDTP